MTEVICQNCSAANRPSASFCIRCVRPLKDEPPAFDPTPDLDERTAAFTALNEIGRPPPIQTVLTEPPAGSAHALPQGTQIEGLRVVRVLGEGGFGIVYLAWDSALERHVAVKEYMPYSMAKRAETSLDITIRAERDRANFDAGLKSFVNEARLLARFDHSALVKVLRFWEGHCTAYMAMPFYEGPTLKAALAQPKRAPAEKQLREWLDPLLAALTVLHGENCYHRDISPDNILLTGNGPLLLDFGAARRVVSDRTQALTAMLKPGFAPVEQYGGSLLQGPWTDLYALAGVVRYAITGRPPVASVARLVEDVQRPLSQTHARRYGQAFLHAIDSALSVQPEDRPQDVAAFRAMLAGDCPEATRTTARAVLLDATQAASPSSSLAVTELVGVTPFARAETADLPRFARAELTRLTELTAKVPSAQAPFTSTLRVTKPQTPTAPAVRAPTRSGPPTPSFGEGEPTAFDALRALDSGTAPKPASLRREARLFKPALITLVFVALAGATWFFTPHVAAPMSKRPPAPTRTNTPPLHAAAPLPETPISSPLPQSAAGTPSKTLAVETPFAPASALNSPSPAAGRVFRNTAKPSSTDFVTLPTTVKKERAIARAEPEVVGASSRAARPTRCGDIVLKASLGPLAPDEMAFLKSKCK